MESFYNGGERIKSSLSLCTQQMRNFIYATYQRRGSKIQNQLGLLFLVWKTLSLDVSVYYISHVVFEFVENTLAKIDSPLKDWGNWCYILKYIFFW